MTPQQIKDLTAALEEHLSRREDERFASFARGEAARIVEREFDRRWRERTASIEDHVLELIRQGRLRVSVTLTSGE